jgi:hypothetical protein
MTHPLALHETRGDPTELAVNQREGLIDCFCLGDKIVFEVLEDLSQIAMGSLSHNSLSNPEPRYPTG